MDIASLLLIFLVMGFFGTFVYFIVTLTKVKTLEINSLEIDCSSGSIILDVRVLGTEEIRPEELKAYVNGHKQPIFVDQKLSPNTLAKIYINFIPPDFNIKKYRLELFVAGKRIVRNFEYYCESLVLRDISKSNITFVAYGSPHWVTFNYITKEYLIFSSNNGDLIAEQGPIQGTVPIFENLNEYIIQNSWSTWENRPIDSPVIIFKFPDSTKERIFNWTDPHGSFLFRLKPIENANEDMLIFWEDLFNPFNPPNSLDDWKDHVVRVTLIYPNTYRIAVYLAKGGYKHQFYILTTNSNPLEGTFTYEKPYNTFWSNKIGNYYEEFNVYYVTVQ